uniref:Mitochondrial ribosomal protein L55 n=1 Tax=Panagrolaimus sp. JU765 TaxID=591449 RepID=A0AC34PUR3_9BILA
MLVNRCLKHVFALIETVGARSISCTPSYSNAYRASLGKIGRSKYIKQYHTIIMLPDGSTIPARTKEPRCFVQFPVDLSTLNEDEVRIRLAARKPKVKLIKEEAIDDNFDLDKYASLFDKKKSSKSKTKK